jgi:uncharacterized lipoprotein YddW (UPF0748 family)
VAPHRNASIRSGGRRSRPIFFWAAALLLCAASPARAADETRAVWVVRYSLTSIGSVDRVVEVADQMNLNTLLVQVRGRGDAYYPSDIVPRAEELGAMPRDYDPLARLIERAHAQGLEVQAWINVYLVWSAGHPPLSQLHVVNAHPGWIAVRSDGRRLVEMVPEEFQDEQVEGMYLAPGNPEVCRHLRDVVREIVTRYPVDGIHLDYVRNPEPDVGYDAGTRTAFMREFGIDPATFASAPDSTLLAKVGEEGIADLRARWMQWQREQVTAFVRDVRNDLDVINPKLKLTAAVIADQTAALNRYLQDWPRWLREGIIDAAIPMAYSPSTTTVVRQLAAARSVGTEHQLYAGIAIYNESARDAADKIRRARSLGVDGVALFSFDALAASTGYARALKTWAFRDPVEPKRMEWREKAGGIR